MFIDDLAVISMLENTFPGDLEKIVGPSVDSTKLKWLIYTHKTKLLELIPQAEIDCKNEERNPFNKYIHFKLIFSLFVLGIFIEICSLLVIFSSVVSKIFDP
ncbi:Uncharacterised protein [uncultured archaeon]|nr:Uncharacterised protein [uncultured archaeon]